MIIFKTMSLGMLGDYGSESEISDSDEESEKTLNGPIETAKSEKSSVHSKAASLVDGNSTMDSEGENPGKGDPLSLFVQNDDTSSTDDSSSDETTPPHEHWEGVHLPLPDLDHLTSPTSQTGTTSFTSVFSNPYKEAEEAQLAMLKRHVSEFAPEEKPLKQERTKRHKPRGGRGKKRTFQPDRPPALADGFTHEAQSADGGYPKVLFNDDDSCIMTGEYGGDLDLEVVQGGMKRKQRSGVSSSLVPPKKYLKSYGKVQADERPWTVRTTSHSHK